MKMFAQSFVTFKKRYIYALGYSSPDLQKIKELQLQGKD
jgi:hypothetical protein